MEEVENEEREAEEDYRPKTIKEAIESCWICDKSVELDLLYESPRRSFDWVYKNLKDAVIRVCDLGDNPELLRVCNVESADDAARVIIKELWRQSEH